jgi:hypothetical protein
MATIGIVVVAFFNPNAMRPVIENIRSGCVRGGGPKRQNLGLFIAAVRAFKRVDGRVAVGGMKIDDSVSYCAAACWAGVIDNEGQRHVTSLSL